MMKILRHSGRITAFVGALAICASSAACMAVHAATIAKISTGTIANVANATTPAIPRATVTNTAATEKITAMKLENLAGTTIGIERIVAMTATNTSMAANPPNAAIGLATNGAFNSISSSLISDTSTTAARAAPAIS